ncbi:MAG: NAD(P)H-hydrate dehydratase [Culturomica sp.]|jgi:NAD(P)H-hydrate epimerase|nr:NAD(P)H-hydrate dehydratase [Culturomica sp.]
MKNNATYQDVENKLSKRAENAEKRMSDFVKEYGNFPFSYEFTTIKEVQRMLPIADTFSHKGTNGHGLLIAGSNEMRGAAILAAKAAVRSGIGLLSCYADYDTTALNTDVPEALTVHASVFHPSHHFVSFNDLEKYNALAIGPGLSTSAEKKKSLRRLLKDYKGKIILDADALNMISEDDYLLSMLHNNCILTPHVKEFERLAGKSVNDFERLINLTKFAVDYKVYVALKGAYTTVATPEGKCYVNTSGNAGMAKGGMGDVLTGVMLALVANGLQLSDAARVAVFAHGLAADLLVEETGERGLCAGMVAEGICKAWKILENTAL